MSNVIQQIQADIQQSISNPAKDTSYYFKTGVGDYAEHDIFISITNPHLRRIAKKFQNISTTDLQFFIASKVNQERLLALFILVHQYNKADQPTKETLFHFYCSNLKHINNWNLVDASAHHIIGAHLINQDKDYLLQLARSQDLWEKRVSIVATWHFIKNNYLDHTFIIATMLLHDSHDLIHKAIGWMLREVGKKDKKKLTDFLDKHIATMPRTTLRYAIERFPEVERKFYLNKK